MAALLSGPQLASVTSYTVFQQDSGTYDLFAQRLDAAGHAIGAPILVSNSDYPDTDGAIGHGTVLKNGGFLYTYDSADLDSPLGDYTSVYQQFDPAGQIIGPAATNGPINYFNYVDTKTVLLGNGGFAILNNSNQPGVFSDESLTDSSLLIGTPSGQLNGFSVVHFETDGGTPLPMLIETQPDIRIGPQDTIIVSFDRYYTPPNPDFPTNDPAGTQHFTQTYDDTGHLVSKRFVDFDGTAETTTYDQSGNVATDYTRHPDGSFDTQAYGIVGKSYTDQEAAYDASGHLISMVRHHADGTLALNETSAANGSTDTTTYDASHRVQSQYVLSADGSGFSISNTYLDTSSNPSTTDRLVFGTHGTKLYDDLTKLDGSHQQTAHAAGVTLTSTTALNDVLVGSPLGSTTFSIGEGAGQDTISQFKSGSGAGHSVVHLDVAAITNFAQLQAHASQIAAGTLITIDQHDTFLLKGIAQSSLVAADFTF